jgi:hypothetical protein
MKQVHKNIVLSRTKTVNNILKIWNLADKSDKYDWYRSANRFAGFLFSLDEGINLNQAAGIIAALSPVKQWKQNKKCAIELILSGDCGHMKQFKNKALAILHSSGSEEDILKILHGQKIQNFYLNIRYPKLAIALTIDRHALSVCLGRWIDQTEYSGLTGKQYQFFAECYRIAALKLNVSPLLVQSVTWLVWRRIKQNYR